MGQLKQDQQDENQNQQQHHLNNNKKIPNSKKFLNSSTLNLKKFRDIPGPVPLPFVGTLLTNNSGFGGKDLRIANEEQVRKYGCLVKQEHYWNHPIVEVFDPDDIEKVMKASGIIRPTMEILVMYRKMRRDRYSSPGIVNAQGDHWILLRSELTGGLRQSWVAQHLPSLNDSVNDFISLLRTQGPHVNEFQDLILNIVTENSFLLTLGKRVGLLNPDCNERIKYFLTTHKKYWGALHSSYYGFPLWKWIPTKTWRDFVESEDTMYGIAQEMAREAMNDDKTGGLLGEFLHSENVDMLDKTTAIMDLIMAGIEPVVNSVIFALYWISTVRDGEVLEKLQTELRAVLPNKDSPIDVNTLKQLPYLKACIRESFRFTPTAPNLARILDQDIQLQGYNIPAYTVIMCQTWHNCLSEKNFYRAKEFLPERWLRSSDFLPHRNSMCGHFGYGKRMCPGKRFAFQELCVVVAKVFRNFRLEFSCEMEYAYEFLLTPWPSKKDVSVNVYELSD